jgi:hypothetical protein
MVYKIKGENTWVTNILVIIKRGGLGFGISVPRPPCGAPARDCYRHSQSVYVSSGPALQAPRVRNPPHLGVGVAEKPEPFPILSGLGE